MRSLLAAVFVLGLAACGQQPAEQDFRQPNADETRIDGAITEVEDAGYPVFIVHVTPESGTATRLYLNAEGGADLGETAPGDFAGKDGTVYFVTTPMLNLFDLTLGGQSLVGAQTQGNQSVTGILSGAEEVTGGDLPSIITVTGADGTAYAFEYYVTPEIVAANGREVTVTFTEDEREEVTLMRAAD